MLPSKVLHTEPFATGELSGAPPLQSSTSQSVAVTLTSLGSTCSLSTPARQMWTLQSPAVCVKPGVGVPSVTGGKVQTASTVSQLGTTQGLGGSATQSVAMVQGTLHSPCASQRPVFPRPLSQLSPSGFTVFEATPMLHVSNVQSFWSSGRSSSSGSLPDSPLVQTIRLQSPAVCPVASGPSSTGACSQNDSTHLSVVHGSLSLQSPSTLHVWPWPPLPPVPVPWELKGQPESISTAAPSDSSKGRSGKRSRAGAPFERDLRAFIERLSAGEPTNGPPSQGWNGAMIAQTEERRGGNLRGRRQSAGREATAVRYTRS